MISPETLRIEKTDHLDDPFLSGGDRSYLIGAQHGGFPDRGWHIEGEMGGLWAPPGKLLDGFWLEVDGGWLTSAAAFTVGPSSTSHRYRLGSGLSVRRHQLSPDGCAAIVVQYSFVSPVERILALRFLARTDLQDVWSPRRDTTSSQRDSARFLPEICSWACSSGSSPLACIVGAPSATACKPETGHDLWGPERTKGNGISVALEFDVRLPAEHVTTVDFIVCGSEAGIESARQLFDQVAANTQALCREKTQRVHDLLSRSFLAVPDPSVERAWDWIKCNYDWLVRDVPGVGRGLGAGAEEFMWWFGCDTSYAVLGCLVLGQHQTAIETLDLVRNLSVRENGAGGRVIHECTTRGEVVDRGRTHETAHFALAVLETFLWTGDRQFLERNYQFCKAGVLGWLLDQCGDGSLRPRGYGIVELEGLDLQCLDTAAYTIAALDALSAMARFAGDHSTATRCSELASQARPDFENAFWQEDEGLYADVVATPADMIPRLQHWMSPMPKGPYTDESTHARLMHLHGLLAQAERDPNRHDERSWLLKNWAIICALDAGVGVPVKALRMLQRVESEEFTSTRGMYLSALDRSHVMGLNTGVLASCEMRYGRVDEGLRYIHMLTDTIGNHMPGAISEILPDSGDCVQAWSGYAVTWPVITYVFGIRPHAAERRLDIEPQFPRHWPVAKLSNLLVGDTSFDIEWDGSRIVVRGGNADWTVTSSTVRIVRQDSSADGG